MSDNSPARDKARIGKEAIAWFTRMDGNPSRSDKRDFKLWLAASEVNRQAWQDVQDLWSKLGPVVDVMRDGEATDLAQTLEVIRRQRIRNRANLIGCIMAGGLAIFAGGGWLWLEKPNLWQDLTADMVTERGERRTVNLADGSTVEMDADTALDVVISPMQRRIRLLRGNVFFAVTPSPVPFTVQAGAGETSVLGTEFAVSVQDDGQVETTLRKGAVSVRLTDRDVETRLMPGQGVVYDASGIGEVRSLDVDEAMSWRGGRFIFTDARLADVLQQIGRYRGGRIVIVGSALGERRVSGNVTLDDTDRALAALQSSVGITVRKFAGKLVIVSP